MTATPPPSRDDRRGRASPPPSRLNRVQRRMRRRLRWGAAKFNALRTALRAVSNKLFTALAVGSVLLIALALAAILTPILWRGAGAVVFRAPSSSDACRWNSSTAATWPP